MRELHHSPRTDGSPGVTKLAAMNRFSIAMTLSLLLVPRSVAIAAEMSAAEEQQRETLAGGAWPVSKFVPCADGVVTSVHSRLEETAPNAPQTFSSGVAVEMKLPTRPKFLNGQPFPVASVIHYDGDLGNTLMQSEKTGDKVQICLLSFPTPTHDLQTGKSICDPRVDSRGMEYRVYDYKRHAAFMGPDSQHGCGGA